MRGNLSKRGLNGSKGEKGYKGDTPSIEFEYNALTGELKYRSDGILINENYISSHDIVTKDQVNELKQLVIAFDDKYVGDKTFEEIVKAINEGKEIVGVLRKGSELIRFNFVGSTEKEITLFTTSADKHLLKITCGSDNKWGAHFDGLVTEDVLQIELVESLKDYEELSNKVTRIDNDRVNDEQYPNVKAVIQHVKTVTDFAKGEMVSITKDYKAECDEKIDAQNKNIDQINARSVSNFGKISALQSSDAAIQKDIKNNADAIGNLQQKVDQIETNCDSKYEDANFRIDSLYSMLESQENKNETQEEILNGHDIDIELLQNDVQAASEQNKLQDSQISDLAKAINDIVIGGGGSGGSGGAALPSLIVNTNVSFQDFANDIKEPGIYQLTRKETTGNRFTSCAYLVVTKQGQYADGCSQFLITSGEFSESPSLMFRQFTYRFDFETNVEEEYFTEWFGVVGQNAINKILNGEDAVGLANRALSDNEGNIIHETYAPLDGLLTGMVKVQQALSADTALQAHDDINGNMIHATYATKAELRPTPITTIPSTLNANTPYNLGELTEISLLFPTTANDGDVIYVNFESGATATNLTVDTSNTTDIDLIPEVDTGYEVYAKYNGSIWIVKYSEYTVSEVA